MRMFLQPRNLVLAAMLGGTGWALSSAVADDETAIVSQGTPADRVFADPQLCLDLDAPAEQFFREVPERDPFQPDQGGLSFLAGGHEDAARKNGRARRTMRELLDEPSCNVAALEAERLFGSARWVQASDTPPPVKHFRVDGVIVYAWTSGDSRSNDSITARLRRAASGEAATDGVGFPPID